MKEIVINACYGGFGLSRQAFLRLRELGCKEALEEPDYGECWSTRRGPRRDYGDGDSFGANVPRDDPLLVKVVKELKEAANGRCAELKVVEIPDDVDWRVEEYDGVEWVAEKHRTWS